MSTQAFGDWVGRSRGAEDVVTAGPVRRLGLTFDRNPELLPAEGDPIPPMWHWLYFFDEVAQAELGDDGHPRRGPFMPAVPGRRMFGGVSADLGQSFVVGERMRLESTITSVEEKLGRSGPLVFVAVTDHIEGDRGGEVTEIRTVVYVEADAAPSPANDDATPPSDVVRTVAITPTLLFRFSALTFNGHRIHYDTSYAQASEGYQERVAHGPLLALLALECMNGPVDGFRFRARSPIFVGDTASFSRHDVPGGEAVEVTDGAGRLALEASADHPST